MNTSRSVESNHPGTPAIPPLDRDFLRRVYLTRGVEGRIGAGSLSKSEVELVIVKPWDTRVNMFGAELFWKVLVMFAKLLDVEKEPTGPTNECDSEL